MQGKDDKDLELYAALPNRIVVKRDYLKQKDKDSTEYVTEGMPVNFPDDKKHKKAKLSPAAGKDNAAEIMFKWKCWIIMWKLTRITDTHGRHMIMLTNYFREM